MIRKAEARDASRIAEILVYVKRVSYRPIFHNDMYSFGELQVLPIANEYLENPAKLDGVYVYEDGFVKGLIHIDEDASGQIREVYVDTFFQKEGIGSVLIEFALEALRKSGARKAWLWVLEKNLNARAFYEKHGFAPTGERIFEEDTPEYLLKYSRGI